MALLGTSCASFMTHPVYFSSLKPRLPKFSAVNFTTLTLFTRLDKYALRKSSLNLHNWLCASSPCSYHAGHTSVMEHSTWRFIQRAYISWLLASSRCSINHWWLELNWKKKNDLQGTLVWKFYSNKVNGIIVYFLSSTTKQSIFRSPQRYAAEGPFGLPHVCPPTTIFWSNI